MITEGNERLKNDLQVLKGDLQVLQNQIQSFQIENQDLKARVQELLLELQLKREEALKAQKKREKKRNYNRLPPKQPVSRDEYHKALEFCKNLRDANISFPQKRFSAAVQRISLVLLYLTGIRVDNLRLLTFQNVEDIFNLKKQDSIVVPLVKSKGKEDMEIAFDNQVKKNYLFDPFNLHIDFQIIKDRYNQYARDNNCFEGGISQFFFFRHLRVQTKLSPDSI